MKPKFINTIPLNKSDFFPIISYLIFSIFIVGESLWNSDENWVKNGLFAYVFFSPLIISVLNYKSLQKIYSALIWLCFSVLQYLIYEPLAELDNLRFANGHAATGLQWIWVFLIAHQIFRLIIIRLQNEEYEPIDVAFSGSRLLRGESVSVLSAIFFAGFFILWILIK